MQTTTAAVPGPWGPYRSMIAERLEACADALGRLTRSLAGRIAPDRDSFTDKAAVLLESAERLVDGCARTDHWLEQCGEDVAVPDWGLGGTLPCERKVGHDGPHAADLPAMLAERAYAESQRLAVTLRRAAEVLAALPWNRPVDDDADAGEVVAQLAAVWRLARISWGLLDRSVASPAGPGNGR